MPKIERNLVEKMLETNLADILAILFYYQELPLFASHLSKHENEPEGFFSRYQTNKKDYFDLFTKAYMSFLFCFHLPPFPKEEFVEEYKKILDNVYLDVSKNEFSFNAPALEENVMYDGKPYFKKAANFFGYIDKTTEPNEEEKKLLELMREHGYPNMECAKARREPTQTSTQTPQQSSGESEPGSRDGRNSEQMQRNQGNRPARDTTSRENPQTADNQIPTAATREFTFSRFRKEPLSFVKNLISLTWEYISSFWRKDKQKAS
jgi:hypothetical protein